MQTKYDLRDFLIIPAEKTKINSRSAIDPFYYDPFVKLPIFTAPMHSVISVTKNHFNKNVIHDYNSNYLNVILPRNYFSNNALDPSLYNNCFVSLSLVEFDLFLTLLILNIKNNKPLSELHDFYKTNKKILIDMANGHIEDIEKSIKNAKAIMPDLEIMVGNIANPNTYYNLAIAGADYVRISIGSGDVCLTSSNTAVGYPIGSLIKECKEIKKNTNLTCKIVADGGMKNYSDIIKALALGADYVMLGSMINKAFESDSYPYLWKKIKIKNTTIAKFLFNSGFKLYKKHIGMSTKEIQKLWGNTKLKTSEGKTKWNRVEYNLDKWTENFIDYLKSSMSYTGSKTLKEFGDNTKMVIASNQYLNRINF